MSTSIKRKPAGRSWFKARRKSSASNPPVELYHQCDQLPLDRFIRCYTEGDLTALVISGAPTPEELQDAWNAICLEYVEINSSPETLHLYFLQREISLLADEIYHVETILYFLSPVMLPFSMDHKDGLVKILHSFGYKQAIDFTTDYSPVLEAIQNRLAPKKIKLQTKEKELATFMAGKEGLTLTADHFDSWLIKLWKMQGGNIIRAKDITVKEYVNLIKEYNKIKAAESAQKEAKWQ
jgi:hypothetical protein